jgi:hypothetical protein
MMNFADRNMYWDESKITRIFNILISVIHNRMQKMRMIHVAEA